MSRSVEELEEDLKIAELERKIAEARLARAKAEKAEKKLDD